jgi:hypothetical protein
MVGEKKFDRDISRVPSPEHRRQYEKGMDVDLTRWCRPLGPVLSETHSPGSAKKHSGGIAWLSRAAARSTEDCKPKWQGEGAVSWVRGWANVEVVSSVLTGGVLVGSMHPSPSRGETRRQKVPRFFLAGRLV